MWSSSRGSARYICGVAGRGNRAARRIADDGFADGGPYQKRSCGWRGRNSASTREIFSGARVVPRRFCRCRARTNLISRRDFFVELHRAKSFLRGWRSVDARGQAGAGEELPDAVNVAPGQAGLLGRKAPPPPPADGDGFPMQKTAVTGNRFEAWPMVFRNSKSRADRFSVRPCPRRAL